MSTITLEFDDEFQSKFSLFIKEANKELIESLGYVKPDDLVPSTQAAEILGLDITRAFKQRLVKFSKDKKNPLPVYKNLRKEDMYKVADLINYREHFKLTRK